MGHDLPKGAAAGKHGGLSMVNKVNVGVDLHKTQFTICARRNGRKESMERYATDEGGYKAFLLKVRRWQKAGYKVRAGVEATGSARYFKYRMEEAGVEVHVINTLKFKIVNESVNKTDKHDASTIAEFLEMDKLPEAHLCSRESEGERRILKIRQTLVRSGVVVKNQVHALLTAEGKEDKKASLQSKKGRQEVLAALKKWTYGLEAQPLIDSIDSLEADVNGLEKLLKGMVKDDPVVGLLETIPGCGIICAATIRAYVDDIKRFTSAKKFVSYCGLAPWVQNSNETVHIGKITKRGPEQLRTAIVQVVLGMRRCKKTTAAWRLMARYEFLKKNKGSGKAIIATARKVAVIIWKMLTENVAFNSGFMIDKKLAKKASQMKVKAIVNSGKETEGQAVGKPVRKFATRQKTASERLAAKALRNPGVARKKIKKAS
jgi:transposase